MYGTISPAIILLLIPLIIWEAVWKAIALWKSARNNQLAWFIAALIFNTVGILPIAYILFFQKDNSSKSAAKITADETVGTASIVKKKTLKKKK